MHKQEFDYLRKIWYHHKFQVSTLWRMTGLGLAMLTARDRIHTVSTPSEGVWSGETNSACSYSTYNISLRTFVVFAL